MLLLVAVAVLLKLLGCDPSHIPLQAQQTQPGPTSSENLIGKKGPLVPEYRSYLHS